MTLWHGVLSLIAFVLVAVAIYWFLYTTRLKTRERTMELKGRPPMSKEEGIAIATLEKERAHKTGSL